MRDEEPTHRVSPLLGSPYDSSTSSRTGLRRFQAPDVPRRLLGRIGSEDFIDGCCVGLWLACMFERLLQGLRLRCCQPISAVEGVMHHC
jgi:hypothetical protein